jgi:hypothetical protein
LSLLRLLLQLFDQLVQRRNDAVLHTLHLLAGVAEVETPSNIVHTARDMIERLVLERLEVGLHQHRHRGITPGQLVAALEQLADRPQPLFLVEKPMMSQALIKQQRHRIDHIVGFELVDLSERLVVIAALSQPAAV